MDMKKDTFFLSGSKAAEVKDPNLRKIEKFNKKTLKQIKDAEESKDKKPFDKKTYRLKKYSKKYKLEQWEEERKKKLLRNYYKDINKEDNIGTYRKKEFDEQPMDETDSPGKFVRHPDLIQVQDKRRQDVSKLAQKKDPFRKAKEQYNKIKEEKANKKMEIEKIKEEKKQKLLEYKKKKTEKFKKLNRKTKRGQPVMTGRLELLLEKIQQDKSK
ncbi:Thyroid transcription factor 1-associated protein 26 [Eumeta japonica]|uniref:Thyroid transcription factor 1-associated protein 26 n=1 Tax=Eumeta variegata TaxID=151549 RepID=A0A4C1ZET9_EUMVA|nr:Thyroid transcription factor 1-associated protein 26 [Eumeta japonica]